MAAESKTDFLYLTTTGRRSGLPREIEIWFTELNGCFYVISEHADAANWVRNIAVNPRVRWRVGRAQFAGTARVVDPAAEPGLATAVRALCHAKYGWSAGLIIQLIPNTRDSNRPFATEPSGGR